MNLYSGGESSRLYRGQYVVRAWFDWPDGRPGEHDTAPMTYEDAIAWLAAAPHVPLEASDGSRIHMVRVQRAVILTEAEAAA